MRVTTSCSGRFHIFDQAHQLDRHRVLHALICDYPRWMTRKWSVPDDKVVSLVLNGFYTQAFRRIAPHLGPRLRANLARVIHDNFSRRLARYLPHDSDIFIGLSSYSLEALHIASERGMTAIVDHGSVHQRYEHRLLKEEADRWGIPVDMELPPTWLLEKEDAEFGAAQRVLALSQAAKRSMVAEGVSAEKIFVNACGVSLEDFRPEPRLDRTFRVIQCGGIRMGKGVPYLLQAFAELNLPDAELWFVGGDVQTTHLKPLVNRFNHRNIHFKGKVPQYRLRHYYSQADVAVLASAADGFGMVVPQAMACGLPVIVTENVGAADIVEHGISGFIVPARDSEALKEKILYLYDNRRIAHRMGCAARQSVSQGYTWNDYGDRLVSFLRGVAGGR